MPPLPGFPIDGEACPRATLATGSYRTAGFARGICPWYVARRRLVLATLWVKVVAFPEFVPEFRRLKATPPKAEQERKFPIARASHQCYFFSRMNAKKLADPLSRREREILNILYRRGRATAAEVQESLTDPPSYSAVRAMLRILEDKGHAVHEEEGARYVYLPAIPRERAKRSALRQLLDTFFESSPEQAILTLLDDASLRISDADLDRISVQVERARREGR